MARLMSVNLENKKIVATMELSQEEYMDAKLNFKNLILLSMDSMENILTTGTLGNSNRIMLPNRLLKENDIKKLRKKVNSKILDINGNKILVIQLEKSNIGIPVFGEGDAK